MARLMRISLYDDDDERVGKVCEVLTSKARRDILRLIDRKHRSVSEIARELNMPLSTAAFHVKVLQEAELVNVQEKPAAHGKSKWISRKVDEINLSCVEDFLEPRAMVKTLSIPIGSYTDCQVIPSCGMASEDNLLELDDNPGIFFSPDRYKAQIIWFTAGYLEYWIPNYSLMKEPLSELIISLEICSEAPNYRNEWASDITFWVNGRELCTWTSPGDFGGRRGRLNPLWWPDVSTQYGLLKSIRITNNGIYLDEVWVSPVKLSELAVEQGNYFTFRVGIKPDAVNKGGINIFGEKYGDHEQNIVVKMKKNHR
ncbi:MAG: helix-turn-helix domain-containing protein [Oscillospiraceae bacterium]|nr:helix-turn-helix domain-containing protein [Oscillospiraceae bacterium]